MAVAIVLTVVGLGLVLIGAERLVDATVGVAGLLRASPFVLSVIVLGFDPENLAVGGCRLGRTGTRASGGNYEISVGNLVGSVLAFFLCNAGTIAVVHPLDLDTPTRHFYLPYTAATVLAICTVLLLRRLPRWAGLTMIVAYAGFVAGAA